MARLEHVDIVGPRQEDVGVRHQDDVLIIHLVPGGSVDQSGTRVNREIYLEYRRNRLSLSLSGVSQRLLASPSACWSKLTSILLLIIVSTMLCCSQGRGVLLKTCTTTLTPASSDHSRELSRAEERREESGLTITDMDTNTF